MVKYHENCRVKRKMQKSTECFKQTNFALELYRYGLQHFLLNPPFFCLELHSHFHYALHTHLVVVGL